MRKEDKRNLQRVLEMRVTSESRVLLATADKQE